MNFSSKQTTLKAGNRESMSTTTSTQSSITSMGWITLLLAFSSASALSTQRPHQALKPGSRISDTSSNGFLPKMRTQSSKLLYAHGDFEDDEYRREEHSEAVTGLRTRVSTIWSNIFPPAKPESEQEVVDDYLEFLDRRYHRLHGHEEASSSPSKPFSVLNWLTDTSSKHATHDAAKSHDDALFVLGVAELASVQLLQKHQIPVEAVTTDDTVIETEATVFTTEHVKYSGLFGTLPSKISTSSKQPSTSILQKVKARRRALIVYQEKQMKRALAVSVKTAINVPARLASTAKALWKHGGGKKTIAMSFSMLTAAFFLLSAMTSMVFESGFTEA
jgi:hypothetical protein